MQIIKLLLPLAKNAQQSYWWVDDDDDDDDDDVILCFLNDDLFAYIHITGMSLSHRMTMINSTSIQSPVTNNITGIGSVAIQ